VCGAIDRDANHVLELEPVVRHRLEQPHDQGREVRELGRAHRPQLAMRLARRAADDPVEPLAAHGVGQVREVMNQRLAAAQLAIHGPLVRVDFAARYDLIAGVEIGPIHQAHAGADGQDPHHTIEMQGPSSQ
jgi:hypothetical protein